MYEFSAYGHPNIRGTHKTTIEFTKDKELSLEGDCIVCVRADFGLSLLKKFIKNKIKNNDKSIKITIKINGEKEEIYAELNPDFNDDKEIVVRKSGFVSKRTLAVKADKGAVELDRGIVEKLKNGIKAKIILN